MWALNAGGRRINLLNELESEASGSGLQRAQQRTKRIAASMQHPHCADVLPPPIITGVEALQSPETTSSPPGSAQAQAESWQQPERDNGMEDYEMQDCPGSPHPRPRMLSGSPQVQPSEGCERMRHNASSVRRTASTMLSSTRPEADALAPFNCDSMEGALPEQTVDPLVLPPVRPIDHVPHVDVFQAHVPQRGRSDSTLSLSKAFASSVLQSPPSASSGSLTSPDLACVPASSHFFGLPLPERAVPPPNLSQGEGARRWSMSADTPSMLPTPYTPPVHDMTAISSACTSPKAFGFPVEGHASIATSWERAPDLCRRLSLQAQLRSASGAEPGNLKANSRGDPSLEAAKSVNEGPLSTVPSLAPTPKNSSGAGPLGQNSPQQDLERCRSGRILQLFTCKSPPSKRPEAGAKQRQESVPWSPVRPYSFLDTASGIPDRIPAASHSPPRFEQQQDFSSGHHCRRHHPYHSSPSNSPYPPKQEPRRASNSDVLVVQKGMVSSPVGLSEWTAHPCDESYDLGPPPHASHSRQPAASRPASATFGRSASTCGTSGSLTSPDLGLLSLSSSSGEGRRPSSVTGMTTVARTEECMASPVLAELESPDASPMMMDSDCDGPDSPTLDCLTGRSAQRRASGEAEIDEKVELAEAPGKGRRGTKVKRRYTCAIDGCGKTFTSSGHLHRHEKSVHGRSKPYKCPFPGCDAHFARNDNRWQHYRTHFAPRRSYKQSALPNIPPLPDPSMVSKSPRRGRQLSGRVTSAALASMTPSPLSTTLHSFTQPPSPAMPTMDATNHGVDSSQDRPPSPPIAGGRAQKLSRAPLTDPVEMLSHSEWLSYPAPGSLMGSPVAEGLPPELGQSGSLFLPTFAGSGRPFWSPPMRSDPTCIVDEGDFAFLRVRHDGAMHSQLQGVDGGSGKRAQGGEVVLPSLFPDAMAHMPPSNPEPAASSSSSNTSSRRGPLEAQDSASNSAPELADPAGSSAANTAAGSEMKADSRLASTA